VGLAKASIHAIHDLSGAVLDLADRQIQTGACGQVLAGIGFAIEFEENNTKEFITMSTSEPQAFAERLHQALAGIGFRPSPTRVAQEFNQRFKGRNVTTHTVRNWLLGQAIPTQDKLRVLAQWLQISPDELRFGSASSSETSVLPGSPMDMADQEMVRRYLGLPLAGRRTVRDVVMALSQANNLSSQAPDTTDMPAEERRR